MKLLVKKGKTSKRVFIFIQDSSSTTGAGLTGLTSGSGSLVCYRSREDDGNTGAVQLSLTSGTKGTWSSGGFVEKDSSFQPGLYELGLDNAGLATGSDTVVYMLKGAANMAPILLEIQLVDFDPQNATNLGLSSLPATACSSNASLLTSGTGTDQLSVTSGRVDIGKTLGQAITLDTNNVINVSTKYFLGQLVQLDANSLPKVDVEDIKGTASVGVAGYFGPDWSHVNAPTSTVGLTNTTISTSQAVVLASAGLDSVVIESGVNARQAIAIIASALAGVLAGAGTTTITIAAINNSGTNRITATVDTTNGNRTAIVLSLPS